MNIKKIESGGVWVKASDELPEKEDSYFVLINGSKGQIYFNGNRFETYINTNPKIEWLKPIKDVYVLTGDEMEAAMNSFMDATIRNFGSKNPLTAKQFIESITKQQ